MPPESLPLVRRALPWLLALAVLPFFLTGCSPFIKVGTARKVTVTLPCDVKKGAPAVTLDIRVGQFDKYTDAGQTIHLNPADAGKYTLSVNPLTIPAGKSGSFEFTWKDDSYRGQGLILLLTEKAPPADREPYLGVVSLVVEPKPCPAETAPAPHGVPTKHFKISAKTAAGRGSHIGTK